MCRRRAGRGHACAGEGELDHAERPPGRRTSGPSPLEPAGRHLRRNHRRPIRQANGTGHRACPRQRGPERLALCQPVNVAVNDILPGRLPYDTAMGADVDESWARIGSWYRRNAPDVWAVLAPGADDAELAAVEEAHGLALPSDLASWWRGRNGMVPRVPSSFATIVPPNHCPASTQSSIAFQQSGQEIGLEYARRASEFYPAGVFNYEELVERLSEQPAGSAYDGNVWLILPSSVYVATEDDPLFVDCREGDLRGCIMEGSKIGGWQGPLWRSVAAMWSEVADVVDAVDPGDWPEYVPTTIGEWLFPARRA